MTPFETLYGRPRRLHMYWIEQREWAMLRPDLVRKTTKVWSVIQENMLRAQSRQKSYADKRRRPLEFEVGDQVFMRTSLMKSVEKFKSRGNLIPRYIRPYEILERIGKVAYRIALPLRWRTSMMYFVFWYWGSVDPTQNITEVDKRRGPRTWAWTWYRYILYNMRNEGYEIK